MNNIPYFKVGDTFHVPIKFFDTETDYPVEITPDMTVSCNIKLSSSRVIYSPVVTVLDQTIDENKGYECDSCKCHPSVIILTPFGRFCQRCYKAIPEM